MTTAKALLRELSLEAAVTRKHLEQVPFERLDFRPSEKSEPLGRLAIHVAEIIAWWPACIEHDHLDFRNFEPESFRTKEALLDYFDRLLHKARQSLIHAKDAVFQNDWSMIHGKEVLFTLPKFQVLRLFCMNHLVHHRAQLGIYLRLLNVPVPATYGPSSDDDDVMLIKPLAPDA